VIYPPYFLPGGGDQHQEKCCGGGLLDAYKNRKRYGKGATKSFFGTPGTCGRPPRPVEFVSLGALGKVVQPMDR